MLTKCTQTHPDANSTLDMPEAQKQLLLYLFWNVGCSFSVSFTRFTNNSSCRQHQRSYFPHPHPNPTTPFFPKCDKDRYRWCPTAMLSWLRTGHRDVIILMSLVLFPADVTVMRQRIWRHFTGDVGSPETGFIPSCHTQRCQVNKGHSGHQLVSLIVILTSSVGMFIDEKTEDLIALRNGLSHVLKLHLGISREINLIYLLIHWCWTTYALRPTCVIVCVDVRCSVSH